MTLARQGLLQEGGNQDNHTAKGLVGDQWTVSSGDKLFGGLDSGPYLRENNQTSDASLAELKLLPCARGDDKPFQKNQC
jgi:hypothetical protein